MSKDVLIIGAGIVGCASAYYLARGGARVTVIDGSGIAAGASGRNNGLVEHPYDTATEALFHETVEILPEVLGNGFPPEPVGTLILAESEAQAQGLAAGYQRFPQLASRVLDPDQARAAEPLLADGLWGCMVDTGHPVMPLEATTAFADLARESGATFITGVSVEIVQQGSQAIGVRTADGEQVAGALLAAAGADTSRLLRRFVKPEIVTQLWGVIVSVELPQRPRHPLIEGALATQHGSGEIELEAPFTLLDSPSWLAVGSTMLTGAEPDGAGWAPRLLRRGTRFVPAIAQARVGDVLVCARPRSFDNRPILGRVPGQERLWVATGHGGRGMSTGPASGRLIAEAIIAGSDHAIPAALSAARLAI